jgi:MoaA/NifB/PqqE/SkfB family radical SAM enzyme
LRFVDHLIISLDSLDESVNDLMCGVQGATRIVVGNIIKCVSFAKQRGFWLSVHSVIAPETLRSIEAIVDFCDSLKISLSVSPEHCHFDPHPSLKDNPEYICLINRLIELKRQGKPIACSYGYLRKIREFSGHRCYPFVSPRVEPDGRVYFPCQEMRRRHVFLQDYENLFELMQKESEWVADTHCHERCFLACYLDVERYIRNPFSLVRELPMRRYLLGRDGSTEPVSNAQEGRA